jgi:hypothetical protein
MSLNFDDSHHACSFLKGLLLCILKRQLMSKYMLMNMKKTMILLLWVAQASTGFSMDADSTGLPGDHFSLEAALAMFKESTSPEDFEKRINNANNGVNNLDLNQDGRVDFLRVKTEGQGDDRALIIAAVLGKDDRQDIAVIEVARQGKESALVQIVGDPNLYGDNRVVEPFEDRGDMEEEKGPSASVMHAADVWINVWYWPCVSWFYGPAYIAYISPWYWDFYPGWWSPWPPYTVVVFYGYHAPYHHHYHHVRNHRTNHIHQTLYMPRREQSNQVKVRYSKPINQYRDDKQIVPPVKKEVPQDKPNHRPQPDQKPREIHENPPKTPQPPPRRQPTPRRSSNPR